MKVTEIDETFETMDWKEANKKRKEGFVYYRIHSASMVIDDNKYITGTKYVLVKPIKKKDIKK